MENVIPLVKNLKISVGKKCVCTKNLSRQKTFAQTKMQLLLMAMLILRQKMKCIRTLRLKSI